MQFQGFEPWSFTPSVERKGADVSIKVWKSLPQDHQEDETTRIAQNPKYRPKSLRIPTSASDRVHRAFRGGDPYTACARGCFSLILLLYALGKLLSLGSD